MVEATLDAVAQKPRSGINAMMNAMCTALVGVALMPLTMLALWRTGLAPYDATAAPTNVICAIGAASALLWLRHKEGAEQWPLRRRTVVLAVLGAGLGSAVVCWLCAVTDTEGTRVAVEWTALAYSVLVAPVCEELYFRGALWAVIARKDTPRTATLLTAPAFALMHIDGGCHALVALGVGLFFGRLREKTGRIWPGLACHMTWNAVVVALGLLV